MKNQMKTKNVIIASAVAFTVFSAAVASKVVAFVTTGLDSSKGIRVSEQNLCVPSEKTGDAHFVGCNSIL